MPRSIHELLAKPFGPYVDADLLTEKCKSVPTSVLRLHDVMLECGSRPIGLTQCEHTQPEYEKARVGRHGIRFRGVLQIDRLDWLTSDARKQLDHDIRQRDVQLSIDSDSRIPTGSPTLERIYSGALRIKVIIQGDKNLPCSFLTTSLVSNGLCLTSQHCYRRYEVVSLDVLTYKDSRKYLGRYRTLRIIEDLIKLDAQTAASNGKGKGPTLPADRTPEWFAKLYEMHMAHSAAVRKRRLIYASSDSDIEPNTGGRLKAGRERTIRHVPRAEVLSLFAVHARWILEEQRIRKNKLLDTNVWASWMRRSSRARAEAAQEGIHWGKDPLGEFPSDTDEDLVEQRPPVPVRSRVQYKTKNKPRSKQKASASKRSSLFLPSSSEEEAEESTRESKPRKVLIPRKEVDSAMRTYDPDFSPVSTPPASPTSSEASLPSRPSTPPNREVLARIPRAFYHRPLLHDFTWFCPVADCDYKIALLELTEKQCAQLSQDDATRLQAGGWLLHDEWVQCCYVYLVSKHYEDHLDEWSIVVRGVGNRVKVEWKNPKHHPSWPSEHRQPMVQTDTPDSPEHVKEEED